MGWCQAAVLFLGTLLILTGVCLFLVTRELREVIAEYNALVERSRSLTRFKWSDETSEP